MRCFKIKYSGTSNFICLLCRINQTSTKRYEKFLLRRRIKIWTLTNLNISTWREGGRWRTWVTGWAAAICPLPCSFGKRIDEPVMMLCATPPCRYGISFASCFLCWRYFSQLSFAVVYYLWVLTFCKDAVSSLKYTASVWCMQWDVNWWSTFIVLCVDLNIQSVECNTHSSHIWFPLQLLSLFHKSL